MLVAAAVGCSAPAARVPAVPPDPQAVAPPASPAIAAPPAAEELESYPLVKDHAAVVAATAGLAVAAAAERPALLMRRAREAVAAAQGLRGGQRYSNRMRDWSDHERFLAFYDLAARDLDELLALSPGAPEAPEALFTVGLIHDYPHLEQFDAALEAYQAAARRFPDSPWAARARERLEVLNAIMNPGGADPHRDAGPAPRSPR